ncbi:MAG: AAA family ATPase [Anaerolineae bacterium]
MSLLRLAFLGTIKFEHDGRPVEVTSAKAIALLAYLAATREPQARERLLGLLWANSAQEAARKNLRNTLWGIGKAFGDHILRADEEHLALDENVWVDVREFEKPDASLDLYQGEFLPHFALPDSPEYEIWADSTRERLAQMYLHALSLRVQVARQVENWVEVGALARKALAQDNLQEPLYRALMEAEARLGERSEALRQYETLRMTLAQELGVEPLPATRALRDAIANGEFERPQTLPAPLPAPPAALREPKRAAGRAPFVGRQQERDSLNAEYLRATGGHARVALLTGEVGIGKSRLWEEWSAPLDGRAVVLECRCLEATQSLPFAPLTELFGNRAVLNRLVTPGSSVPRIWLAELARLLPEIRVVLPELPMLAGLPAEEERRRIFEAFTQCLLALHGRPFVLFVDDLHWADHATLDWLDYFVHRLQDEPLLLIAAYRPEDAPAHLIQMTARWGREGLARRIQIARLTQEEAHLLVAALAGQSQPALQAQAQSGGNPYFLIELARAQPGQVPPVLTDLVRARLDLLSDTARQVLQAAAMLEADFDFAALRRTSGRGEEETLDALDTLLDASVLIERDSSYSFTHPLVATVVREGLSGARRVFLHRRAAEALEATRAGHLPAMAGRLAVHYAEAGDKVRAAQYAEMAGEHALALAAPEEAIAAFRRALEWAPTPGRSMALGRVLLQQVELDEARAAFETALHGYEAEGDRRGRARAAMSIAETLFPSARFADAQRWMELAFHAIDQEHDAESRVLLYLLRGSSAVNAGDPEEDAQEMLDHAVQLAVDHQLPDIGARASFIRGNLLAERGDLAAAIRSYEQTSELAHAAGNDFQEVLGHNNAAYHALLMADLAAAHAHIDAGLAIAEARALRLPLQHLYSTRGEIALAEKKWGEAEEWFTRGLVEAERNRNRREQANYRANLGLAARGLGDLDSGVMLIEAARSEAAELAEPHLQTKIDLHLAELYRERGERAAALEALDRAQARLKGSQRKGLQAWAARLEKEIHKARS